MKDNLGNFIEDGLGEVMQSTIHIYFKFYLSDGLPIMETPVEESIQFGDICTYDIITTYKKYKEKPELAQKEDNLFEQILIDRLVKYLSRYVENKNVRDLQRNYIYINRSDKKDEINNWFYKTKEDNYMIKYCFEPNIDNEYVFSKEDIFTVELKQEDITKYKNPIMMAEEEAKKHFWSLVEPKIEHESKLRYINWAKELLEKC